MKLESNFDFVMKICLLGQTNVGKTNLITRFTENKYSSYIPTTIAFDYKSKVISLNNPKKKVKLNIYDTAGQERFMSVCKSVYQRSDGIILVYDITRRESFEYIPKWIKQIKEFNQDLPIILFGNKIDDEDNRIVSFEEGKKYAEDNNMDFFETSAKNGRYVNEAFIHFGNKLIKNLIERKDNISLSTEIHNKKQKKKYC